MPCGMLGAATTPWSQPPRLNAVGALLLLAGGRVTKETATPDPKVALLPAPISTCFTTLAMACVNFITTMPTRLTGAFHPLLGGKTKKLPNLYQFSDNLSTHQGQCHAFPGNCQTHFLTDKLTHDWYLVDTGATLSIVPCTPKTNPSGPLIKGTDGQPIPSWGFVKKTFQFPTNCSLQIFCKPLWPVQF